MNSIEHTTNWQEVAIPAQQSMSDTEYLDLLCKTFIAPHCKECGGNCCRNCGQYDGYLYRGNIYTKAHVDILKKKYGWTKKHGFLSPTGCKLPRKFRSATCDGYVCQRIDDTPSLYFHDGLLNTVARRKAHKLAENVALQGIQGIT